MSLSMDEQRMLAEIERRLSAEDPRLAAKLSAFRRPGPAGRLRSPRGRIIGSLLTVALVAVISMTVYAMVPFRAHGIRSTTPRASSNSASAHTGPATSSAPNVSAQPNAGNSVTTVPKMSAQQAPVMSVSSHPRTIGAKGTNGTKMAVAATSTAR